MVANSLLAYASVNHLHYHFMYIAQPLLAATVVSVWVCVSGCTRACKHVGERGCQEGWSTWRICYFIFSMCLRCKNNYYVPVFGMNG